MRFLLLSLIILLLILTSGCPKSPAPAIDPKTSSAVAPGHLQLSDLPDPTVYYETLAEALPPRLQHATLGATPIKFNVEVTLPPGSGNVQRYLLEDRHFLGVLWKMVTSVRDPELREAYQILLETELTRTPKRLYIALNDSASAAGKSQKIMDTDITDFDSKGIITLNLNGDPWSVPHSWGIIPEFKDYWQWGEIATVHEFLHIQDILSHPNYLRYRKIFFKTTGGNVTEEVLSDPHQVKLYWEMAASDLAMEARAITLQTEYVDKYQSEEPRLLTFPDQRELLERYHRDQRALLEKVFDLYAPSILANLDEESRNRPDVRQYFLQRIPLFMKELE